MNTIPKWYKRAKTFILEQRRDELKKAQDRYPGSNYFYSRRKELAAIEAELETFKEE